MPAEARRDLVIKLLVLTEAILIRISQRSLYLGVVFIFDHRVVIFEVLPYINSLDAHPQLPIKFLLKLFLKFLEFFRRASVRVDNDLLYRHDFLHDSAGNFKVICVQLVERCVDAIKLHPATFETINPLLTI